MRVAVVGCGRIAYAHAEYLKRERDVDRLAACDPNEAAATRFSSTFSAAKHYTDFAEMLEAERPDVVHVCTPPAAHHLPVVAALRAGAHVLVEKPLTLERRESSEIAAALLDNPGLLCVDHNFLFEPEMLAARTWIQEGLVGRIVGADMFFGVELRDSQGALPAWAQGLPGGAFTDLVPHPIYLLIHLLGNVRSVSAFVGPKLPDANGMTELRALLDCDRGVGHLHVSFASAPYELNLVVRGTKGTVRVEFGRQRAVLHRAYSGSRQLAQVKLGLSTTLQTSAGVVWRLAGKSTGSLRGYPGMRILVNRFYESVRRSLPPPVTFTEGAQVTEALVLLRDAIAGENRVQRESPKRSSPASAARTPS